MNLKNNIFLNGLGMGLLVISSAALAEATAAPEFSSVDKDTNGSINVVEAKQVKGLVEIFGQLDANADGKLTLTEYTEGLKKLNTDPRS